MENKTYHINNIKELEGISGVYKIYFNGTNNFYIGSSNNIYKRIIYHRSRLKRNIHENACIKNAFNKYGINNCFIEVMIECNVENLLKHEQYFIDTLKPEYNIKKNATGGMESILSKEDVLYIRYNYYNRKCQEDVVDLANKYNLSLDYIGSIARGKKCFSYIKNTPEILNIIKQTKNKRVPLKYDPSLPDNYTISKTRKLNADQIGMIKWAIKNNKSTYVLLKKLNILVVGGSLISRIKKGLIYKEYTTLVDASHFNLPKEQTSKLSYEDIPKIRWAHKEGISHTKIAKVFNCHYNTSCDIKMGRVYKQITDVEPCKHLFNIL